MRRRLLDADRQLDRLGVDVAGRDIAPLVESAKARSRTITHLAEQVAVRLDASRIVVDDKAAKLMTKMGPAFDASLALAVGTLEPLSTWAPEPILEALKGAAEKSGTKLGDLMQPIRVALTGSTVSEPVNELLAVVGKGESLKRLQHQPSSHPAI